METLTYTYDAMNRRTSEVRTMGGARTFGYDGSGQLLQIGHSGGNATFSYDAVGNRLGVTGAAGSGNYTANALNQYMSAGGLGTLTYDTNGNLASGGGWSYSHNADSRLTSVSGPATGNFGRDGSNREVKRTINGETTYRIYDGWNLIAEYGASGALSAQYIHGPQTDEILVRITSVGSTYPVEDGLGSTIAVTDLGGVVLERVFYTDGFGTPEFRDASGNALPGTTTGTHFLFTGREWLAEFGFYDYRNRTYSPWLGRFLQTDPIRFQAGDVNLYRYVANNPINLVDPEGLLGSLFSSAIWWYQVKDGQIDDDIGHCLSHCELAKEFGPNVSEWFGNAKEWWDKKSGTGGPDHEDDEAANAKGRMCANDPRGCSCCCGTSF